MFLNLARIICSEIEFLTSVILILSIIGIHIRGNVIKILGVSFILTAISFTMQNLLDIGLFSAPVMIIAEVVFFMTIFGITIGITLIMTLIEVGLLILFEGSIGALLGALNIINPDPEKTSILEGNLIVLATAIILIVITLLLRVKKIRQFLPNYTRYELYGNAFVRNQFIYMSLVILFLLVICVTLFFFYHPNVNAFIFLGSLVVVLILSLIFSYQMNKRNAKEKYKILDKKYLNNSRS